MEFFNQRRKANMRYKLTRRVNVPHNLSER
jgi:hypothetical protein